MREEGRGKREHSPLKRRVALLAVLLFPLPASLFPQSASSVVLVSIDGFKPEYLDSLPVVNLRALAARGVRAKWMQPSMPTQTFPNHYTIVTGLYPGNHGVINNTMVDPADSAWFMMSDTLAVRDSRWWGGEPIWVTAEKQGVRSASFFWPGSEAVIQGRLPTFWKRYRDNFPNLARVDTVLAWLSRRDTLRPRVITLYFSLVDHEAHDFGPWGRQTRAAAVAVDRAIGRLVRGLARAGLADRVNLVVVSDHGMAATAPERVVRLDDYLPPASLDVVQLSPFFSAGVPHATVPATLAALRRIPHFTVFPRDSTPERWHYRGNDRIPPLVGVMDEGWELTARRRRPPRLGNHGFDNLLPSMRATFIAAGPAFRRGVVLEPFQNIHVYSLLCAVLGVQPAPNDGALDSLRAALRQPR